MPAKIAQLLRLALARRGPFRARDLHAAGIPRAYLARLVARNELEHVGRGLYRLRNASVTELHALAKVAKRVPHATICLLSALQVHGLTTELPRAVWIMIDTRARAPRLDTPTLEIVRARGAAREYGRQTRSIEGVEVHVTTAAKTVADCFQYRRHVGLDVALAALRDYLAKGRKRRAYGGRGEGDFSIDALLEAAKAARVTTVIRPYLEALA